MTTSSEALGTSPGHCVQESPERAVLRTLALLADSRFEVIERLSDGEGLAATELAAALSAHRLHLRHDAPLHDWASVHHDGAAWQVTATVADDRSPGVAVRLEVRRGAHGWRTAVLSVS